MGRLSGAAVAGLCALVLVAVPRPLLAQSAKQPRLWARFTFDWSYGLAYERRDVFVDSYRSTPSGERQVAALVIAQHRTLTQRLDFGSAFSIRPWIGVGVDASLQEDFTAPSHPWLERLGLRLNRRTAAGLGVFGEFRPWQSGQFARRGAFFRVGLRSVWSDVDLSPDSAVISRSDGLRREVLGWSAFGYRVRLGPTVSFLVLAEVGGAIDVAYAGLRLGGGLH